MSIIQGTGKSGGVTEAASFYDYPIGDSLRFDGSSYLSRTFGTPTNGNKWVYSYWQKGMADSGGCTISAGNYQYGTFVIYEYDWLRFGRFLNGYSWLIETDQIFRDPSAWRHIVIVWDTTLSSNQVKIYVNGNLASLRSANHPSSAGDINSAGIHKIGVRVYDNTLGLNGYLANIQLIDGQALDASYFGETKQDIWVPKAYTGSYGTNGFHLDFADSSNIGNDVSGNNNDWTVN
jgi:hypothetical protein